MALSNEPAFDAPIPGMSLTHELGARPWQTPPQFPTVDEAVEFYMSRMTSEEFMEQLIDLMETGIPVTTIANTIQLSSVMEGKHTVDVGMLVLPLLMELMMMLGDSAGIEYTSGLENPEDNLTRDSLLAKYAVEYTKTLEDVDTEAMVEDEPKEEDAAPTGLMARRK